MRQSTRISLTLGTLVLLTAATVTWMIFRQFNASLVDNKILELQRETEVQSTHFIDQVQELTRDTRVLASTPPIQGIIRASRNNGIDPIDGSSLALWKSRLETIFSQTLEYKTNYLQLRYIGIADGGREIVRADHGGEGGSVRVVPDEFMQNKAGESYFKRAVQLSEGDIYLSRIKLNRERGQIQMPPVPVLRSAVPVFDERGKIFGLVVINFRVRDVFKRMVNVANTEHTYYILNADGYYLQHPDERLNFGFEFGEARLGSDDFPLLSRLLAGGVDNAGQANELDDSVVGIKRVDFGSVDDFNTIYLVASDDFADITEISENSLKQVGLVLVALVMLAVLIGILLARVITRPIASLTDAVKHMDTRTATLELPTGLTDEAAELGAALEEAIDSLSQRNEELKATNRELKQFAYIASHDLQEPVRTVNSFSELLMTNYADQLDDRGQHFLRFIRESSERMRELILGLLEYSRLGTDARPEHVALKDLVDAILRDMDSSLSAASAAVYVGELPELVLFRLEVRLLFQNLIGNAVKYRHPDRSPVVRISSHKAGDNRWRFEVEDNGMGIAPEHRQRVFLIFQRLHARHEYEGTGIGLAHCRKIVELHRGRIWIEAADNGGSIVKFELEEAEAHEQT